MTTGTRTSSQPHGHAVSMRRTSAAIGICFIILVIFVIAFPKGGVKMGGVPLTWGYMLLGLLGLFAVPTLTPPPQRPMMAYLSTLPFQLIIFPLVLNTIMGGGRYSGMVYSVWLNFVAFPFVFYILFSSKLRALSLRIFAVALMWAIRFIATYGVFLFFYKIGTGKFVEVPYLTVNVDDVGMLETKNIMRGDSVAKLISTYNNGNIYGVCFGLLLPIYLLIEKSRLFIAIAWISLFLTVSRTAWAGGFFLLILIYFIGHKPTPSRLIQGAIMIVFAAIAVTVLLDLIGRDEEFLFDPTLGNRTPKYEHLLVNAPLLPTGEVGGIGEISYLGVMRDYGILGFLASLPLFFAPVFLSRSGSQAQHPLRRAGRTGLYAYLFMSLSDGAMLLIPVMAIFYFVALIAMEGHVLTVRDQRQRPHAAA